jgi:hypothetical protein
MSGSGISLSLQLGGGRAATSSGRLASSASSSFSNAFSLVFDGVDDYVDTNDTFQATYRSNHTISFWLNTGNSAFARLFGVWKSTNSNSQNALYYDGSGSMVYRYTTDGATKTTLQTSFSPNNSWQHYASTITQSGSNIVAKAYLNGQYKGTQTITGNMSQFNADGNSFIGLNNNKTDGHFDGLMDEVAVFPSALSDGGVSPDDLAQGDIATLYNNGVPGNISSFNPIAWFRMGDLNGGSGDTITNAAPPSSTNGTNATVKNGVSGNTTPTYSTSVPTT